ncbi:dUTP diphosphatase [Roseobacter sp.]|uniref:dUTP diphosphatase n=1 Tax=Roseobacter sp. TaxID=1907202 RepID=UPI0038599123
MVQIKLAWDEGADQALGLPAYQTSGAAGADVRANLPDGAVVIAPGARVLIPTGLKMEIPVGYEIQVRPRSGLALKHGIMLVNSPGTIDSDYRGPVGVIMMNAGEIAFDVTHGMRIAQLVLAPVVQADFYIAEDLSETARGDAGFGSSGEN